MLCIPAMSSIIVSPEANQMTRMQMAVVARPVRTVHAVVALASPDQQNQNASNKGSAMKALAR